MTKKNNVLIVVSLISLLLIAVGASYAFFTANITGGESASTISTTAGTLSLTVNGGNTITVSDTFPQNNAIATKTFTLTGTNTTDLVMPYTINLVIDANTFNSGSIKYTLISTNTDSNGSVVPSILTQTGITTGTSTISLGSGNFSNGTNKVHTYILNLYYPDTGSDQNAEQEKSLAAHISIIATKAQTFLNTKILGAGNSNVTSPLTTPGQNVSSSGEAVLASTIDDYGTSYYFRGAVNNNWVKFANMYWRIIRINGDGTIRMIYSGTVAPTVDQSVVMTGTGTQMGTSSFNNPWNNNMYVGYKYTSGAVHGFSTNSTIKNIIDTWYSSNLSSYTSKIADAVYCNDRSNYTDTAGATPGGGIGTTTTYYGPYVRLYTNKTPVIKCPNTSDAFTVSDTTYGNAHLTNPVGLLTADEAALAGAKFGTANNSYYLYTSQSYWMSSPYYTITNAFVFNINSGGSLNAPDVSADDAARPVISLKSDTSGSGTGTWNDPYIVS